MFAFALWDKREKTLTLARDRYGVKPLYYALAGNAFLFGSEIKAILAHGAYRTQLDKEALLEYFTFQNFFTARTLFKGVHLLPAGCHLTVGADGRAGAPVRYWDYHFPNPSGPRARPSTSRSSTACSARRCHASSSATWTSAPTCRAAWTRARSPRLRRRSFRISRRSRRLRPELGLGRRAGLRRAREGRAHVVPVQDRALRDGAQGGRHGARAAAPRVAPRGAARRPKLPELLHRSAGEQIRQGGAGRQPAATNCSPGIRGAITGPW